MKTAQIIVLSDYRKAKTEPKDLSYAEWVKFCLDPFGFLAAVKPKPQNGGVPDAGQKP